jgi:hypothetical protein
MALGLGTGWIRAIKVFENFRQIHRQDAAAGIENAKRSGTLCSVAINPNLALIPMIVDGVDQEAGKRIVPLIEQMFVEGGARHHFAPMQRQIFPNAVFTGCQGDGGVFTEEAVNSGVDMQSLDFNCGVALSGGTPDKRAQVG